MSNQQPNLDTTDPELRRIIDWANEVLQKNSRLTNWNHRLELDIHEMSCQYLNALANNAEDKRMTKRWKEVLNQRDRQLETYAQVMDRILEKIGARNKFLASTTTSGGDPQLLPKMLTVLEFLSKNGPPTGNQNREETPTVEEIGGHGFRSATTASPASLIEEAEQIEVITITEEGEGEGEGSSTSRPRPVVKTEAVEESNPPSPASTIPSDESNSLRLLLIKAENAVLGVEEGMSRLAGIQRGRDILGATASTSTAPERGGDLNVSRNHGHERKRSGIAWEAQLPEGLKAKIKRLCQERTPARNRLPQSSSQSARPIKQENEDRNPVFFGSSKDRSLDRSSSDRHDHHGRKDRDQKDPSDKRPGKGNMDRESKF